MAVVRYLYALFQLEPLMPLLALRSWKYEIFQPRYRVIFLLFTCL